MSFDINPPSRNLSNVQASQGSCPGGGGNTGYFRRGKKEEDVDLHFASDYPEDSFEKMDILNEDSKTPLLDAIFSFFNKIFDKIKSFFIKTKPVN